MRTPNPPPSFCQYIVEADSCTPHAVQNAVSYREGGGGYAPLLSLFQVAHAAESVTPSTGSVSLAFARVSLRPMVARRMQVSYYYDRAADEHTTSQVPHPFNSACSPLNHGGNPGVNGVSHRGVTLRPRRGVGRPRGRGARGGLRWTCCPGTAAVPAPCQIITVLDVLVLT